MESGLDSGSTLRGGIQGVAEEDTPTEDTTLTPASDMGSAAEQSGAVAASAFAKFRSGLTPVDIVIEDGLSPSAAEKLFAA